MRQDQMDAVHEKVIELKSRVDRHSEAITRLEAAGEQSEKRIADLTETVNTFVTSARLLAWVGGIIIVASQSGVLAAIKVALGI